MTDTSPQHTPTSSSRRHGEYSWSAALVLLIIVAAGAWFLIARDAAPPFEETVIPGVQGFQGMIESIEYGNAQFVLYQNKRVVDEVGENEEVEIIERRFTVAWDDETTIRRFSNARAVYANITATGTVTTLRPNRGVVVVPRTMRGDTILADRIFVLPGVVRTEIEQ